MARDLAGAGVVDRLAAAAVPGVLAPPMKWPTSVVAVNASGAPMVRPSNREGKASSLGGARTDASKRARQHTKDQASILKAMLRMPDFKCAQPASLWMSMPPKMCRRRARRYCTPLIRSTVTAARS